MYRMEVEVPPIRTIVEIQSSVVQDLEDRGVLQAQSDQFMLELRAKMMESFHQIFPKLMEKFFTERPAHAGNKRNGKSKPGLILRSDL
jgi:hypothetical protein